MLRFASALLAVSCLVVTGCGKTGPGDTKPNTAPGKTDKGDALSLKVTAPANTSVKQGETVKVTVKVNKDNFKAPVKVSFGKLPDGVSVATDAKELMIPIGKDSVDIELKAAAEAKPVVPAKVEVMVESEGLHDKSDFMLEIKQKD